MYKYYATHEHKIVTFGSEDNFKQLHYTLKIIQCNNSENISIERDNRFEDSRFEILILH
jgi:hypothetical protein